MISRGGPALGWVEQAREAGQSSTGHRRLHSKPDHVEHQSAQPTVVSGESQAVPSQD